MSSEKEVEATLMVALGDLSSLFDLESLRAELKEGSTMQITLRGEHKNGERKTYCVVVERDSV